MRVWVLIPDESITDDRAYLIGHLQGVFDEVLVTRTNRLARHLTPPDKRPDLILNLISAKCRDLLTELDSIALKFDISISPTSDSAWNAEDKRTYIDRYVDVSPPTRIASSLDEVARLREFFGGAIVVKDPLSHAGNGVERILHGDDLSIAQRVLDNTWNETRQIVVQPYYSGFSRGDKRVLVQRMPDRSHQIIAHIFREPPPDGWKSNLRSGGRMRPINLSDDDVSMAIELAKRSGLDNAVLDLGEHQGRTYFIEVNCTFGGIIDYDMDRAAANVRLVGEFLLDLAKRGRGR